MTNPSKIIEWYRPNPFVGLAWISFHSSLLMLGGAIIMAFGRDTSGRVPSEIQNTCIVIGIILVIIGVLNACYRIYHHLAKQDVSIVLSTRGLHYVTSQRSIAHSDDNTVHDEVKVVTNNAKETQDNLEEEQSKLSDDETLSELFIPWQKLGDITYTSQEICISDTAQNSWKITHHFLGHNRQSLADRIKEVQRQVLIGVVK